MSSRVAAYGFLGKWSGDVRRDRYLMPSTAKSPLRDFRLYALLVWPDAFSGGELLLSLKVQNKDYQWKERLIGPEPLGRYRPEPSLETAHASVPLGRRSEPGRFHTFVGDEPLGWSALVNSAETAGSLSDTPAGAVAVRWSGALRGLLLLGTRHP